MIGAGLNHIEHIKNLNVIGIVEVLKHYPRIKKIFNKTVSLIKEINPQQVILIDYPGFNMRLAKKVKKLGVSVTYFILPQVWAWNSKRAEQLKKLCDKLVSIIPFEKQWFKKRNIDVHFVGHPLISILDKTFEKNFLHQKYNIDQNKKIVALMPGSRKSEIKKHWGVFLDTIKQLKKDNKHEIQPVLIQAPNIAIENVPDNIIRIKDNHYEALSSADVAIVCSGTATLETALLRCPMVVCYKLSSITWFLAKRMASVKHLSLVNLIVGKEVVAELLQNNMKPKNIAKEIYCLLSQEGKAAWKQNHALLVNSIDTTRKNPYQNAAKYILQ
jgi:lipid-A-disaccharide synthase